MTPVFLDTTRPDFVWRDGERLIAFGPSALASLPAYLRAAGMENFVLLATERSVGQATEVASMAAETVFVRHGRVDEIAGELLDRVGTRPVLAVGGGRVIDVAKSIGGANGEPVAALPTTLSGAPMTPFHRLPAGFAGAGRLIRPKIVIGVPDLMASQPRELLVGSAMNALSHAIESIFVTTSSPVPRLAAQSAISLLYGGIAEELGIGAPQPETVAVDRVTADRRARLSLGALEAGFAVGATGYAVHHVLCQTIVRIGEVPHAPTYGVMLPYTLEFLRIRDAVAWEMVAEAMNTPEPSTVIAQMMATAGLPTSLKGLGVAPERINEIVAAAEPRAQLGLTPGGATSEDLRALVEAAF
ncbi:MAG: iron-containing alcohol dehydrogenase [Actinobacteria bacterium]|nr:iron-containing alcohol dehydrogenase [Actinomycetota bacterium]